MPGRVPLEERKGVVYHEPIPVAIAGYGEGHWHHTITKYEVVLELLPGQLYVIEAMGHSGEQCPITSCPVYPTTLLST